MDLKSVVSKMKWELIERIYPDKKYLSVIFKRRLGYQMDWKNPVSFNQKLQWMKLYDRNPLYSQYADKIAVRDFVAETIGERYLIPALGIYEKAEQNIISFVRIKKNLMLKQQKNN